MKLVIVESPTKAKTLSSFLGKGYIVRASYGHIRDLPKSKLGVDVEKNFLIDYEVSDKGKKIVRELKKDASSAQEIFLATDLDREGEAISWHLKCLLEDKKNPKVFKRVVFHEITESEIKQAFSHPQELNYHLVDSQQARRVLDRLVGYKLSPLLWKKVRYGLSAGRVQSVAVRLVVERERERQQFIPEEYWSIECDFLSKNNKETILASLIEYKGKKVSISNQLESQKIERDLKDSTRYVVAKVEKTGKKRNPYPPLKTSTLQQAGANVFGFNSKRTMSVAQKLFEKGYITYHRTDSLNLSPVFLTEARSYISNQFGDKYLPPNPNFYKSGKKTAQEAHEAIRPTKVTPYIKGLTEEESKIYTLIFKRSIESQMSPMEFLQTSYFISSDNGYTLKTTGSVIVFDGWFALGKNLRTVEEDEQSKVLPVLEEGDNLTLSKVNPAQHFTQPPPRYSDATLIKTLEDLEIGRPSTYAPTISTIQDRGYIKKDGKYFYPDDIAFVVTDLLVKYFPEVIDYQFTAQMEEKFDQVATGEVEWVPVIRDFYMPFEKNVSEKDKELHKADFTFLGYSDEICPKCGSKMMTKLGKFGKFLSCSNYPVCEFAKPLNSEGVDSEGNPIEYGKCDKCGSGMILKMGRFGKFLACRNFPKCKNIKKYLEKIGVSCPICLSGDLVVKKYRGRTFYGCSNYPECKFNTSKNFTELTPEQRDIETNRFNSENTASQETPKKPAKVSRRKTSSVKGQKEKKEKKNSTKNVRKKKLLK